MGQDLLQRFLVGGLSTILIAILIFFAEFSFLKWLFVAAIAAVTAVALWEYYQLVVKKKLSPKSWLGIVFAVLYVFAVFIKSQGPYQNPYFDHISRDLPVFIIGLGLFSCFVLYSFRFKNSILHLSTTFFGLIYIAVPLALFVSIMYFFSDARHKDLYRTGSWWIVYLIAVTKAADMGGYFIGKRFGRRKLAMRLSPNKTLEGFFSGLISSLLVSLLICFLGKRFGHVFIDFSYIQAVWLGILMGVAGQLGDLAESLLKRDAEVKDSNTIPGVGGILDMVDSLLFTAPVVYMFLRIFSKASEL